MCEDCVILGGEISISAWAKGFEEHLASLQFEKYCMRITCDQGKTVDYRICSKNDNVHDNKWHLFSSEGQVKVAISLLQTCL